MDLSSGVLLTDQNTSREEQLVDRQLGMSRALDRALKALDPYLSLAFVGEHATEPGLRPGRWHVRRENPGTVDTYLPLVGPNGEYREPTLDIVDLLRANDMWRDDVTRAIRKHGAEKALAAQRRELEFRDEKKDEFQTRVKAMDNPSFNFDPGRRWQARLKDHKQ